MNPRMVGGALALVVLLAPAQTNIARPEFAVASIRRNTTGCCASGEVGNGGGGKNVTLKMLIATAYRVQVFQMTSPEVNGPSQSDAGPNRGAVRFGAGSLTGDAVPLSFFASTLSQRLDRPIVDRTNLKGRFDIRLQWTPGDGEHSLDPGAAFRPGGSRPFCA